MSIPYNVCEHEQTMLLCSPHTNIWNFVWMHDNRGLDRIFYCHLFSEICS